MFQLHQQLLRSVLPAIDRSGNTMLQLCRRRQTRFPTPIHYPRQTRSPTLILLNTGWQSSNPESERTAC